MVRRRFRSGAVASTAIALTLVIATGMGGGSRPASAADPSKPAGTMVEQFAPISATTWWAVVEGDVSGGAVIRTVDGGRHREEARPAPYLGFASSDFLNTQDGWVVNSVEAGAVHPPPAEPLFRTVDGGRHWQQLADVANGCQLIFVDPLHGWCDVIGAAAGSEGFTLYRTSDGGASWTLASSTGPDDTGTAPGDVPFGCDKSISFTSPAVGWLTSFCAGGSYYLFTTTDGGTQWQRRSVPMPPPSGKGAPTPDDGAGLGTPVVAGEQVAVSAFVGGMPGTTAVATSTDGGTTWTIRTVPQPRDSKSNPNLAWDVDLFTPTHWLLSDGSRLMGTTDAGAHWHTWNPKQELEGTDGTLLALHFLTATPLIGWAVPGVNGGPLWHTTDGGHTWDRVRQPFGVSVPEDLSVTAAVPWRSVLSSTSADPIRLAAS
jgi:photosystem II stability/assembly factor-like uncharacterized protein